MAPGSSRASGYVSGTWHKDIVCPSPQSVARYRPRRIRAGGIRHRPRVGFCSPEFCRLRREARYPLPCRGCRTLSSADRLEPPKNLCCFFRLFSPTVDPTIYLDTGVTLGHYDSRGVVLCHTPTWKSCEPDLPWPGSAGKAVALGEPARERGRCDRPQPPLSNWSHGSLFRWRWVWCRWAPSPRVR